jgi:hypothetical protein
MAALNEPLKPLWTQANYLPRTSASTPRLGSRDAVAVGIGSGSSYSSLSGIIISSGIEVVVDWELVELEP